MSLILLDVDGPIADLDFAWLARLNERDGTFYLREDITYWEWFKDKKGHKLLNASIYNEVEPVEGAQAAVDELRTLGHDVVFLTSCNADTSGPKIEWLRRYKFLLKPGTSHPDDVIIARRKELVRGDVIIDDGEHNLINHPARQKLLWDEPWNRHIACWPRRWARATCWRNALAELAG